MIESTTLTACQQLIVTLSQQHGWILDAAAQQRYAETIAPLLLDLPMERWPAVVCNFHDDHETVLALGYVDHPKHEETWQLWCHKTIAVLRHSGRDWARDIAVDTDDIAQVASMALVRSLPTYRYRSHFNSWAYSVIERCARDYIRATKAQRRSGNTSPLDVLPESNHPQQSDEEHKHIVHARLLAEHIAAVLNSNPDKRLANIFQLWALEQRSSAEIGTLLSLHESRIRALLKLARELLRDDPTLQDWHNEKQ